MIDIRDNYSFQNYTRIMDASLCHAVGLPTEWLKGISITSGIWNLHNRIRIYIFVYTVLTRIIYGSFPWLQNSIYISQ